MLPVSEDEKNKNQIRLKSPEKPVILGPIIREGFPNCFDRKLAISRNDSFGLDVTLSLLFQAVSQALID
jgi:hypothetical protein